MLNFNFSPYEKAFKDFEDTELSGGQRREVGEIVSFFVILCLAIVSGLFIWSMQ